MTSTYNLDAQINALTHLYRVGSSISTLWTGPFPVEIGSLVSFHYDHVLEIFLYLMQILWTRIRRRVCGVWSGSALFANVNFIGHYKA